MTDNNTSGNINVSFAELIQHDIKQYNEVKTLKILSGEDELGSLIKPLDFVTLRKDVGNELFYYSGQKKSQLNYSSVNAANMAEIFDCMYAMAKLPISILTKQLTTETDFEKVSFEIKIKPYINNESGNELFVFLTVKEFFPGDSLFNFRVSVNGDGGNDYSVVVAAFCRETFKKSFKIAEIPF